MADHRKLKVWQLAQDVAVVIWRETRQWETDRSVTTIRQIRASSESISANIAEGNGRSPREFNRYLTIALGSANETDSHLVTLMHRAMIDLRVALQLRDDITKIRRMIIALQRANLKSGRLPLRLGTATAAVEDNCGLGGESSQQ